MPGKQSGASCRNEGMLRCAVAVPSGSLHCPWRRSLSPDVLRVSMGCGPALPALPALLNTIGSAFVAWGAMPRAACALPPASSSSSSRARFAMCVAGRETCMERSVEKERQRNMSVCRENGFRSFSVSIPPTLQLPPRSHRRLTVARLSVGVVARMLAHGRWLRVRGGSVRGLGEARAEKGVVVRQGRWGKQRVSH